MSNFRTRPIFHDRQIVQYSGNSVTLSGVTIHDVRGQVTYDPTILYENPLTALTPTFPATAFTPTYVTGMTQYTLAGLTGYQYPETFRPNGVPLIISPPIRRVGFDLAMTGGTGTTTVDVTGYILTSLDANGTVMWEAPGVALSGDTFLTSGSIDCGTNVLTLTRNDAVNITVDLSCIVSGGTSGGTDTYVTGGTINCGTGILSFNRNDGSNPSVDLSCLFFTGNTTGNCITDLYITNLHGCSPITVHDNFQNVTSTASGNFANSFGRSTTVLSNYSTINGGYNNSIGQNSTYSFVGGGYGNIISGSVVNENFVTIGGGYNNKVIETKIRFGTIGGGYSNTIEQGGGKTFIGGGSYNISNFSYHGVISGGFNNTLSGGSGTADRSVIGGGGYNKIYSDYSVISGGKNNTINNLDTHSSIGGGLNNIISSKYSSIGGGRDNVISNNSVKSVIGGGGYNNLNAGYGVISGGRRNAIQGAYTFIGGGIDNKVTGTTTPEVYSSIVGGQRNTVRSKHSVIGGGLNNTLVTGSTFSSILAGQSNTISYNNSHIIGSNITATESGMTYVEGLTVTGNWLIHSDVERLSTDLSVISSIFNGSITTFDTPLTSGYVAENINASGNTGMIFGNITNFPSVKTFGTLLYYGTGYTRPLSPTTGVDFYRNKIGLRGADDVSGMVINPNGNDPNATLWFEIDGTSVGILHSNNGYWGFGLDIDGTELPIANVQVGSTANTATFVYNPANIPSSSGDTTGNVGEFSWDDTYFYIKTNTGWGRVSLDYAF